MCRMCRNRSKYRIYIKGHLLIRQLSRRELGGFHAGQFRVRRGCWALPGTTGSTTGTAPIKWELFGITSCAQRRGCHCSTSGRLACGMWHVAFLLRVQSESIS